MRLPFIGKIDVGLSTESDRKQTLKHCGIGALLVLLGLVVGVGLHFIYSYRSTEQTVQLLRLADAPDNELTATIAQYAGGQRRDGSDALERETLWLLVRELMNRGKFAAVEAVAEKLIPPQEQDTPEWARRMLQLAHALVKYDKWDKAQGYYTAAQTSFQRQNLMAEYAGVVRERAGLLSAGSGGTREERLGALQRLLTQLPGQGTWDVAAELRIFIAKLQISLGTHTQAQETLREIIAESAKHSDIPATLQACLGYAHLALGEDEEAVESLRCGLRGLSGTDGASRVYCALVLRDLATVALNIGHEQEVLALLERVDATAGPVIPPSSLFRTEIIGKRAKALYLSHDYEYSLRIFQRQLEMLPDADEGLRVFPLEGIGWSYLALGQPEQALQVAQECRALREQNYAEDKLGLGKVYLLNAQAQDQGGHPAAAEEMYGKAAAILPAEHPLRTEALEGQASALTQEKRWVEAIGVWEQLLLMVPEGDEINREHIENEIKQCRNQLHPPEEPPAQAAPARPAETKTKPARRTSAGRGGHRSTRRRHRTR